MRAEFSESSMGGRPQLEGHTDQILTEASLSSTFYREFPQQDEEKFGKIGDEASAFVRTMQQVDGWQSITIGRTGFTVVMDSGSDLTIAREAAQVALSEAAPVTT